MKTSNGMYRQVVPHPFVLICPLSPTKTPTPFPILHISLRKLLRVRADSREGNIKRNLQRGALAIVDVEDPNEGQGLELKTVLNGEVMQHSSTSDMIYSVAEIVSFLSQSTTLLPGTIILTGTPEGVG